MRSTPYESAAAPTSHSATDHAEFNIVCRTRPDLPNQTDSNAALLPYLPYQLGSAHEWSGVWNGPKNKTALSFFFLLDFASRICSMPRRHFFVLNVSPIM